MPKKNTRESFRDLHAAPVREGETWKQYVDRLRGQPTLGASEIAGILCATALMGQNPNAPARGRMLDARSECDEHLFPGYLQMGNFQFGLHADLL